MKILSAIASIFTLTSVCLATTTVAAAPRVMTSIGEDVISMSDDGWYQVQDAYDYTTLCQGARNCVVSPGLYIVTNHTTGQRYLDVVVRDRPDANDPIKVVGNIISWPDDGWYQVQRAEDNLTVCNGGRSCKVEYGAYNVINHTTGQRFRGILANDWPAGKIPPPINSSLDDSAPYLIESLAGYQLDYLEIYIEELSEKIKFSALSEVAQEPVAEQFTTPGVVYYEKYERTEYACLGGGSMAHEWVYLVVDGDTHRKFDSAELWVFQNCEIQINDEPFLEGKHFINGTITKDYKSSSPNERTGVSERNINISFADFSLKVQQDFSLSLNASVEKNKGYYGVAIGSKEGRYVRVDELEEVRDGMVLRNIQDATFQYTNARGQTEDEHIRVTGKISGSVTQGKEVSITTIENLARKYSFVQPELNTPFSGQMRLSTDNGSTVNITARPNTYSPNSPVYTSLRDGKIPFAYDYTLTAQNGDILASGTQRLPTFLTYAPFKLQPLE